MAQAPQPAGSLQNPSGPQLPHPVSGVSSKHICAGIISKRRLSIHMLRATCIRAQTAPLEEAHLAVVVVVAVGQISQGTVHVALTFRVGQDQLPLRLNAFVRLPHVPLLQLAALHTRNHLGVRLPPPAAPLSTAAAAYDPCITLTRPAPLKRDDVIIHQTPEQG